MQDHDAERLLEDFAAGRKLEWNPSPDFAARVKSAVAMEAAATDMTSATRRGKGASGTRPGASIAERAAGLRGAAARLWGRFASPRNVGVAFACLSLAFGAILWRGRIPDPQPHEETGTTRIKGEEFRLGFLAGSGSALTEVGPGQIFAAGDRLQPLYSSAREGYIALFSIDEAGTVTGYSGEGPRHASPPAQGRTLPYAIELDGSRGGELFIALRTTAPADRRKVEGELRRAWEENGRKLAGLRLRPERAGFTDAHVSTFRIAKQKGETL